MLFPFHEHPEMQSSDHVPTGGGADYSLETHCLFDAPAATVWRETVTVTAYPLWWPAIKKVVFHGNGEQLHEGSIVEYHLRGFLPYTLVFSTLITACVPNSYIQMEAFGALQGVGRTLLQETDGVSRASFHWDVSLTSPLLRWVGRWRPLHALFSANHDYCMRQASRLMKARVENAV